MTYITKEMTYITKSIFTLVLLSGCSSVNSYKEISTQFIGIGTFNPPYKINANENNYIKVSYGKHYNNYFRLSKDFNNLKYWVSDNEELIITSNLKVIKTLGFDNNFEIINAPNIMEISLLLSDTVTNSFTHNSKLSFTNPETSYMDVQYIYTKKDTVSDNHLMLLEEIQIIKKIGMIKYNYYWIDKNQNTVDTKQTIIPNIKIRIN